MLKPRVLLFCTMCALSLFACKDTEVNQSANTATSQIKEGKQSSESEINTVLKNDNQDVPEKMVEDVKAEARNIAIQEKVKNDISKKDVTKLEGQCSEIVFKNRTYLSKISTVE